MVIVALSLCQFKLTESQDLREILIITLLDSEISMRNLIGGSDHQFLCKTGTKDIASLQDNILAGSFSKIKNK